MNARPNRRNISAFSEKHVLEQTWPKTALPAASSHCTVLHSQRHTHLSRSSLPVAARWQSAARSSRQHHSSARGRHHNHCFGGKCLLLRRECGKAVITCSSSQVSVRHARARKKAHVQAHKPGTQTCSSSSDSFQRKRVLLRLESVFACGTAGWGILLLPAACAQLLCHKRPPSACCSSL